jgi:glycyl-tRNA synthetase beta subunit
MNPYVIGGVALIIAIMGWQLKSSITRNGELEAKLETQAEETLECTDANASNDETITTLEDRIAAMIEERQVDAAERERILTEREQELLRARAEADRLRELRDDEQAENQDCADLLSLDVERFCPTTADQLRERSRGAGGDGDTDSS